jgi:hypothetical protein
MKNNNKLYTKTVNVLTIELEEALLTLRADSEAAAHLKAAIAALTDLLPPQLISNPPQIDSGAEIRGATATQDTMLVKKVIDSNLGCDQRAGQ